VRFLAPAQKSNEQGKVALSEASDADGWSNMKRVVAIERKAKRVASFSRARVPPPPPARARRKNLDMLPSRNICTAGNNKKDR
jgi:hypothetical protein